MNPHQRRSTRVSLVIVNVGRHRSVQPIRPAQNDIPKVQEAVLPKGRFRRPAHPRTQKPHCSKGHCWCRVPDPTQKEASERAKRLPLRVHDPLRFSEASRGKPPKGAESAAGFEETTHGPCKPEAPAAVQAKEVLSSSRAQPSKALPGLVAALKWACTIQELDG